jgi:hypothetical protein
MNGNVLPAAVFAMDHPFTWDDIRAKVQSLAATQNGQASTVDDLEIDLYLQLLTLHGILKQKGSRYTF